MKQILLLTTCLLASLNLLAEGRPSVKKLPVKITVTSITIDTRTGEKVRDKIEEDYTYKYNNIGQLIEGTFHYTNYGEGTRTVQYTYNLNGTLSKEEYIGDDLQASLITFKYDNDKGVDLVSVYTAYKGDYGIDHEDSFRLDATTGLYVGDKGLDEDSNNYHEYTYDADNNLMKHFHNFSTSRYEKTETYEYSTVYSPYVCINNLPVWYWSSLLVPRILFTGKNAPTSYTEKVEFRYDEDKDSFWKTIYTITTDDDNYPIKIQAGDEPTDADTYLIFKEYEFTYQTMAE